MFDVIPLPRSTGFPDSFRHAGAAIVCGYSVLVFPGGRRSDDGLPQPFRAGSGLLWKALGVPVIPVRIDGLGELKTAANQQCFGTGRLSVWVGEPVPFDPTAPPEELTRRMRAAVYRN